MALTELMHLDRVEELGRRLDSPPPGLLASPATADGHVDPARMLALLRSAEADG